jgi:hypothetical protein
LNLLDLPLWAFARRKKKHTLEYPTNQTKPS